MRRHLEGGALTTFYSKDTRNMLHLEGLNCLFNTVVIYNLLKL